MMYHMTKKNIDQLLDVFALDLIVDVHHGGQQVPEVPKSILIRFPFKKIGRNDVSHDKKKYLSTS